MQNYRIFKLRSIMEAVNWVCDDALDEHVWVSEQTITLQEATALEALQYDFEMRCIVHRRMSWFCAPTSLNNELLNDGVILDKVHEAVNLAFQSVFTGSVVACLKESGTCTGAGWVGDWVRGPICCLSVETVTTTWILRMRETLTSF